MAVAQTVQKTEKASFGWMGGQTPSVVNPRGNIMMRTLELHQQQQQQQLLALS